MILWVPQRQPIKCILQGDKCPLWQSKSIWWWCIAWTLEVPSLVAIALIVPGSPTSTTTFHVNFSVISARTGGSRWVLDLLLRVDEASDTTCRWNTVGTFFCERRRVRIMSPLRTRSWMWILWIQLVVREEVNAPCSHGRSDHQEYLLR